MDAASAQAHLQAIRTLMERAALYRRALAPVMTLLGIIGISGAVAGFILQITKPLSFVIFWMAVGALSLVAAFFLIRRQAVAEGEKFWSPPARRVAQAILPPLVAGIILTVMLLPLGEAPAIWWIVSAWTALYGCALHAGGFFTARGLQRAGWAFLLAAAVLIAICYGAALPAVQAHFAMGAIFGGLHLAYGAYLHMTERTGAAA